MHDNVHIHVIMNFIVTPTPRVEAGKMQEARSSFFSSMIAASSNSSTSASVQKLGTSIVPAGVCVDKLANRIITLICPSFQFPLRIGRSLRKLRGANSRAKARRSSRGERRGKERKRGRRSAMMMRRKRRRDWHLLSCCQELIWTRCE